MSDEIHISSAVVQARPAAMAEVLERLATIPGLCVHAAESGKIIVTLETDSEHTLAQYLNQMSLMDGVYTATLVSHFVEPDMRSEAVR